MFSWVREIVAIIVALVTIVERPGDGPVKREQVIDLFLEKASEHIQGLPAWAKGLFMRRSFVGWLVDVIVWVANQTGFFGHTETHETASGAS